jgi:hypothetical protein
MRIVGNALGLETDLAAIEPLAANIRGADAYSIVVHVKIAAAGVAALRTAIHPRAVVLYLPARELQVGEV